MVTLFTKFPGHREEVFSLYKALLRHARHLPGQDERIRLELMHKIRYKFRQGKISKSGVNVRKFLEEGHEMEQSLREFYKNPEQKLVQELLDAELPPTHRELVKARRTELLLKKYPPRKPKGDPLQPLEKQREGSYVNAHIKYSRRYGLMPKVIDPEILEHIIKPEALFKRAKTDIKIEEQKLAKGPYRVKKAEYMGVPYLRTMGPVDRRTSGKLLNQKISVIQLTNMELKAKENLFYCEMETRWEHLMKKIDPKYECFDWREFITDALDQQRKANQYVFEGHKQYANNEMKDELIQQQAKANMVHLERKERFARLLADANGVTAHDDLLGSETLPEIVQRHGLGKRRY